MARAHLLKYVLKSFHTLTLRVKSPMPTSKTKTRSCIKAAGHVTCKFA